MGPVYDSNDIQTDCVYSGDVTIVYDYDIAESDGSNSDELKEDDIHLNECIDGYNAHHIGDADIEVTWEKMITVTQFINWLRKYASGRVESVTVSCYEGQSRHTKGVYEWFNGKLRSVRTFDDMEIDSLNNQIVSTISGKIISDPITLNPGRGKLTFEISIKINKEEM